MSKESLSPAINLWRNEVNQPPSYNAEVRNEWSSISIILMFPKPAWGQLSYNLYKNIYCKINIDRRCAEKYSTPALTLYVLYYKTAHVTEWCTRAVRRVARATKLYR